jgi:DNA-binding response OmpR family regulator
MRSILIVDDEEFVRQHLQIFLIRSGAKVYVAGDGLAAIDMFKEYQPGVVLLDIHLPGIKGDEVFREMKGLNDKVQIYFISGSEQEIERLKAANTRADGYLVKPLFLEQVMELLKD